LAFLPPLPVRAELVEARPSSSCQRRLASTPLGSRFYSQALGFRLVDSRLRALLSGINLMSHFTCSRPENHPSRHASVGWHPPNCIKNLGKKYWFCYRGVDSCLRRNDEGKKLNALWFSSHALEKIQKTLCFQELAFSREKYSGQQCALATLASRGNDERGF